MKISEKTCPKCSQPIGNFPSQTFQLGSGRYAPAHRVCPQLPVTIGEVAIPAISVTHEVSSEPVKSRRSRKP